MNLPVGSAPLMGTEKILTIASLVIAGLVALVFLLDVIVKIPFGQASLTLDILFILGGAFVIWQGIETLRELR